MQDKLYNYKAEIEEVIDGDTVDVKIDVGFSTFKKIRLRLNGIDTPEVRTSNDKEKKAGKLVSEFVRKMLRNSTDLYINTKKKGSFGRYLADIYIYRVEKCSFNQYLIEKGFAKKYDSDSEWTEEELDYIINKLSSIKESN